MEINLENTIALLSRTPGALDALLRELPEAWTVGNEGENTWSVIDVLRHLVYVERKDWIMRAKTLREGREIGRVDREAHVQEPPSGSPGELLEEFARLRRENLRELGSWKLTEEELAWRGNHKALGEVTLSQLLSTWAIHDLTHLHQISRILAHQYREAVGPWSTYLGVLKCDGHSSF
jgi:uncharacterized damage-inducible protein DinB